MKRGALLLTLLVAAFTGACSGGGGGGTLPPPPPLGFSNSSLNGQYAFTMTGQASDGFIARIGTFIADGKGGISAGGIELVSTASNGFQLLNFLSSNYQIQSDGRGVINLSNITTGQFPLSFSITMTSTTGGIICQTDGFTGTSGTFQLQDTSAFTKNAISGPFAFNASGLDPNGTPDSIVGQFTLNDGTLPGGVYDENDGAVASGPQVMAADSYFLDATNGTTNGLGQLAFNGFVYDFIIVNSKKIFLIEEPGQNSLAGTTTIGTAFGQSGVPANNAAFNGSYAFLVSGIGITSADFKLGRFTANGGALSAIAMDEKLVGDPVTQVPNGSLSAMSYTIDPSFPNSGRGTVTFKDSNTGTYSFIFYMASPTQGVIQDNSNGIIGDGTILAQTGTFSNMSIASEYAFNWNGTSDNQTNGTEGEEDFVGHVTVSSAASNNVTGAMDFSELNLVDPAKAGIHNSALNGTITINGDGTTSSGNRSTLKVTAAGTNGAPSTTFNFSLYPVNASTMFVINTDMDHSTGGVFTKQITPP